MKRNWLLSISLAVIILLYGTFMQFLPLRNEISSLQAQNQSLKLQISKIQSTSNQRLGFRSDTFYAWLVSQHLQSIHLLAIASDKKNIHVQWQGEVADTLRLLYMLQESRFTDFTLHQAGGVLTTNFNFTMLLAQEDVPAVAPQTPNVIQPKLSKITRVLGKVERGVERFCVVEMDEKIVLQKGRSC